ncbi:unnamed protein product [Adineta steineri]|uniref:G-protein coupled receptors family 1 profile domain-containing protein n=1 Tax=Adineta steineri TaxID=433720 RepID=A0A815L1A6_9BILA|nr:unnamed protein product [Adineta steineri]CAF3926697.1 unnamed protein product [Adineta steineri]CAF4262738.1 unnamed protein product [Adineta steineri]
MSLSNATLAEINALRYGNIIFYQFWSYSLVCLGTIGHSLNIYVFTRPTLRSNPCTRYFLAASISGIHIVLSNVLLRLLQMIYPAYNPFGYSTASCKILSFIVFCTRFLCSSTSATVRAWSSRRVATRAILIITIIVPLFYLYVPIIFQNIQTVTKCPPAQTTFPLFNGIWNLLIFSLGPSTVMLIFGLLTIRHVQRSGKRIVPQNIQVQNQTESITLAQQEQLKRQKTTDRQLLKMMLVQCVYFSLLSTPVSALYIYTALRINIVPDALQLAKDSLFTNITGLLSGTSGCTSFYVFTLSSRLFRRELMQLFKCQWRRN